MRQSPRVFSVTNQKGGVGKTTTAVNLGAALAEKGRRVLIIDLDPQGNASTGLGILSESRVRSTYDFLLGDTDEESSIQKTGIRNLWIVPATVDLSSADVELMSNDRRSHLLKDEITGPRVAAFQFDYILIDCPPALNILTVNALVASHSVIVPLQSEFYALEGLSQLMLSLREVRDTANPGLGIEGIVLTMYDKRNNLSRQVEEDARENLGDLVFQTVVPRNVRLSEAPSFAVPVLTYDTGSTGSQAYRDLAQEVLDRERRS